MKHTLYILLLFSLSLNAQIYTGGSERIHVKMPGTIFVGYPPDAYIAEYNDKADSLFAYQLPKISSTRKGYVSMLFDSLDTYYPDSILAMWVLKEEYLDNSLINWYDPSGTKITAYNYPSFVSDSGWIGDGDDAYLATGYIPSNDVNYLRDQASCHVWCATNITTASKTLCGTGIGNRIEIAMGASNNFVTRMNNNTQYLNTPFSLMAVDSLRKFNSVVRWDSTNYKFFKNGIAVDNETEGALGIPTTEFCILAQGAGTQATANTIQFVAVGTLRQPLNLYTIIARYFQQINGL